MSDSGYWYRCGSCDKKEQGQPAGQPAGWLQAKADFRIGVDSTVNLAEVFTVEGSFCSYECLGKRIAGVLTYISQSRKERAGALGEVARRLAKTT